MEFKIHIHVYNDIYPPYIYWYLSKKIIIAGFNKVKRLKHEMFSKPELQEFLRFSDCSTPFFKSGNDRVSFVFNG